MKTEIEISLPESKLTQEQRQTHTVTWLEGKNKHRLNVHLRYDDECGNGHNTFAITGELYINGRMDSCGCLHDEIAKYAPEFKQFIKWHLVSSDGPMHYLANTIYHASDKDHNGLRKGERKQLRHGGKTPVWQRILRNAKGEETHISPHNWEHFEPDQLPDVETFTAHWEPVWIEGEGKERDFNSARSCAVWPEAADAILSLPKQELEQILLKRLPKLMEEFKQAMESLGFIY